MKNCPICNSVLLEKKQFTEVVGDKPKLLESVCPNGCQPTAKKEILLG